MRFLVILGAALLAETGLAPLSAGPDAGAEEESEDEQYCFKPKTPTIAQTAWMAYECASDAALTRVKSKLYYVQEGLAVVGPDEYDSMLRLSYALEEHLASVKMSLAKTGWHCGTCMFIPAAIRRWLLDCYVDEVAKAINKNWSGSACGARTRKYLAITRARSRRASPSRQ
jgi:hypothetical protein